MEDLTKKYKQEIDAWLNSPEKDFDAGFELFARFSHNRALALQMARLRKLSKLEYELQKITDRGFLRESRVWPIAPIVKAAGRNQEHTEAETQIEKTGKKLVVIDERINYDELPDSMKKLYDENRETYKLMRAVHEKMKLSTKDKERAELRAQLDVIAEKITENCKILDDWAETLVNEAKANLDKIVADKLNELESDADGIVSDKLWELENDRDQMIEAAKIEIEEIISGKLKIISNGKEISFNDLPPSLQVKWEENRDSYKLMRAVHEKMKLAQTDEEREKQRTELVALDDKIAANWKDIDNFATNITGINTDNAEAEETRDIIPTPATMAKDLNACRSFISRNAKKAATLDGAAKEKLLKKLAERVATLKKYNAEIKEETRLELVKLGLLNENTGNS